MFMTPLRTQLRSKGFFPSRQIGLLIPPALKISAGLTPSQFQPQTQPQLYQHLHQNLKSFHTTSKISRRSSSSSSSWGRQGPPRFNQGPPFSRTSLLWHLVPAGAKALFGILGAAAFVLFVAGPILVIVVPPLILGGFIMRKVWARRKQAAMGQRWDELSKTSLVYQGGRDAIEFQKFVQGRIIEALKSNEQDISKVLVYDPSDHQLLDVRFRLGGVESIDEDLNVSSSVGNREHIEKLTVVSFGLYDTAGKGTISRIATVILSLRPQVFSDAHDAIIEIKPLLPFRQSIILNTPGSFDEPPIINIRPKRQH